MSLAGKIAGSDMHASFAQSIKAKQDHSIAFSVPLHGSFLVTGYLNLSPRATLMLAATAARSALRDESSFAHARNFLTELREF